MVWVLLVLAGFFEIIGAVSLKYAHGFTRLWPTVVTFAAMTCSFGLLAHVLKQVPVGTAYAVWTGIGSIGTAVVGILVLGESASFARIICIVVIASGIIALKFVTPAG